MRLHELNEDGRIVKGVNTTVDVGVGQIPIEAKKFGFNVDKDGHPPTLSTKVKGKSTNVLFNLGVLEESVDQRTRDNYNQFARFCVDTLGIQKFPKITMTGKELDRTFGYFDTYDESITVSYDRRHQMDTMRTLAHELVHCKQREEKEELDGSDGSPDENEANTMAGVLLRRWADKNPQLFAESVQIIDEKWSEKYKRSINCNNPRGFSQRAHCQGRNKNESISDSELQRQLAMGVEVEMEHTNDRKLALKIAMDHIKEDPLYYDHLKFVEIKEALGEIASATEIYVDMDGVLADFFGSWAKLMNVDHWSDIGKEQIPQALDKIRQTEDFWLNLPLTNNAKQLLNLIKEVKGSYKILSSPLPDDPNSEPHKREWVEKNLSFFPPDDVIITHDKAKYATQQDGTPNILIDDYGVNINSWEAAGGYGFKHKDHKFERTAKNIQQHMQEPVDESIIDWVKTALNSDPQFKAWYRMYKEDPEKAKKYFRSKHKEFLAMISENFADGKVSGNSRPGRVARSGASCDGSVSELRKKASNSSGERAKMYHWCANMKAGRNK